MSNFKHGCWCRGLAKDTRAKRAMYFSWRAMKSRCTNPKNAAFKNYGGRGITFDPRWSSFLLFFEDMRATHRMGLELERIDNEGDYYKSNCRWATSVEQHNNTRANHFVEQNGKRLTIAGWVRETGIPRHRVKQMIKAGNKIQ